MLESNLEKLIEAIDNHRKKIEVCGCNGRWLNHKVQAQESAKKMPLSVTASGFNLELIWEGRCLKSQRCLNNDQPKRLPDGSNTTEFKMGTDNDVFFFAGPPRYPRYRRPICLLFGPRIEETHSDKKVATPFDSGGLDKGVFVAKDGKSSIDCLRAHEMPVPEYRLFFADWLGTIFEKPFSYLLDDTIPLCESVIPVRPNSPHCDDRRWTFEVRLSQSVSVDKEICAVFIPKDISSENWCREMLLTLVSNNVSCKVYQADDGQEAWNAVQSECLNFIKEYIAQ
jgi:hypothetical protein